MRLNGNKSLYAALIAGVALFSVSMAAPAHAISVTPEFQILENPSAGTYTVINNSGENGYPVEYIYAFAVTNPAAPTDRDWTTQPGWYAGKTFTISFHPKANGFIYGANLSDPPFTTKVVNRKLEFLPTSFDLGPGTYSDFFFGPAEAASTGTLFLVGDNILSTVTLAPEVTPLPSTWVMLLGGFICLSLFAYGGSKKASAATLAARSLSNAA